MSDERTTTIPSEDEGLNGNGSVVQFPRSRTRARKQERRRIRLWLRRKRKKRFRIRKLRVLIVLFFLGVLAAISTAFGMFMALAADLPKLENAPDVSKPSVLLDKRGEEIGTLTGNERRIYLAEDQIADVMKQAIVAIEDRRFWTNSGVDVKGIARAAFQNTTEGRTVSGASTIPQQYIKISLAAENNRTAFQKLREAALAYQLTRRWSKDRILRNYLNTIYFGNGAYGIESAARTYFGYNHDKCEPECAKELLPHEAAMLAGIVASPSAYDPAQHPKAARERRDLVLQRMFEQGYIPRDVYEYGKAQAPPSRYDLTYPKEDTKYPYFTSWVKQQVVDQLGGGQQGARLAFDGGLKVKTTIDSRLQSAAQRAIKDWLGESGPRASLVAISNKDGMVRAMVGGDDSKFDSSPFNLATQGQRQPGSAFKPFVLAEALKRGISPGSTWESKKRTYILKGGERFTVNNYDDSYLGVTTLANATTFSDNAVYVQVAKEVGTKRVARLARDMGIRTPVSTNLAVALGGLRQGVTPLDMAHAYQTFATGGLLVTGSLSPGQSEKKRPVPGPVGIERMQQGEGKKAKVVETADGRRMVNKRERRRVLKPEIASEVSRILQTVVKDGTAERAQIPGVMVAGKTGTTESYGDAWFVGWTKEYTVAVWVGYPDEFKPMETEFRGEPVAGGTYPAAIWKSFMMSLLKVDPLPKADGGDGRAKPSPTPGTVTPGVTPAPTAVPPSANDTQQTPPTEETAPPPATEPEVTPPPVATPPPTATEPPPTDPGAGGVQPPATDGAGATG
ncbi:transglycosylase domain-containing protein [Solirubrobacter sp. CPCC 204708]|uniref:Transglycosylase domain-containing protein n=1 Tax=Solirubrobacter deserti TaxID=2282478 RepID=A0ABT4RTM2_9ACTN|nr:transglycosylase domain-containing protein [Solirubrobacter deserti]MBE2315080.1 transglycosylase domain-containing protein [Solirubrobacter deserti]MDA0141886.1 transglycosylase domain-containing protein [Solirubrobacter deserti]